MALTYFASASCFQLKQIKHAF